MHEVIGHMSRIDKETVLSALRATRSCDAEVLRAHRATLLANARFPALLGTWLMILGAIVSLTVLLAVLGLPMVAAGWRCRKRGLDNVAAVEAGFHEHAARIGLAERGRGPARC